MAEMRAETRYAKQLFLYGDGSGQPVRNIARLSKLSGVTDETIRKYLPAWEKEAAQLLASSSEVGLALTLSSEKVEQHTKDLDFLRDQLNKVRFEIESLEKIAARLAEWMDKFDGDDVATALQIFDAWQRASGSEFALRGQFLALQKQWTALSGIVDLKDISVTQQKEIAKGKAKLEVKRMETEANAATTTRIVSSGVFARPAKDEIC